MSEGAQAWFRWLTLLAVFLLGFWKALPSVLDAFERRQSGIELRTEGLLDAQTKRFEDQLARADERHDECMEGQRQLRIEMAERDKRAQQEREQDRAEIAQIRRENADLWGMLSAMRQGAQSVEDVVAKTIKDAREAPKDEG